MDRAGRRLPLGVFDQDPDQREAVDGISRRVTGLFGSWGYRQAEPPVFEYYETFRAGGAAFSEQRVYRFLDRNGMLLALRPDMTTGIARMVATQLSGMAPGALAALFPPLSPMRLFYAGPVFRSESAGSGRPHMIYQAGVELIGPAGPAGDAEVVSLALAAVSAAGAGRGRVVVGHAGLAWQVLAAAGAPSEERNGHFREAARQRDLVALHGLLGERMAALVAGGPHPWPAARGVLADLGAAVPGAAPGAAELESLFGALSDHGIEDMMLDLTLVRDLDYYTGMVFEVLVSGLAAPLAGGGRYDQLLARFGASLPATGFALDVGAAAGMSPAAGQCPGTARSVMVAAASCDLRRDALGLASALRAQGFRVETTLHPAPLSDALRTARLRGANRLLFYEGAGYREIRVSTVRSAEDDARPVTAAHQGIH